MFCAIVVRQAEASVVYEDETVVVFMDPDHPMPLCFGGHTAETATQRTNSNSSSKMTPLGQGDFAKQGTSLSAVDDPLFDVAGEPYLAGVQVGDRRWKVRPSGQLVRALPADPAEPDPDLVSAHQARPPFTHAVTIGV